MEHRPESKEDEIDGKSFLENGKFIHQRRQIYGIRDAANQCRTAFSGKFENYIRQADTAGDTDGGLNGEYRPDGMLLTVE